MPHIADLHIHSKYSRATSREMNLENLQLWAQFKGIQILATADFTHPQWFQELKQKLAPSENGLFELKKEFTLTLAPRFKNSTAPVHFILSTEISCIYSKNGRTRRLHLCILAPSFEAIEKINTQLNLSGNLKADGRPILGLDAKRLLEIALEASPECLVIPAHAWTPWFAIFGSQSGFDSLEECFEDLTPHIYAIETGLSSDPSMNWRLSTLDDITLISNSDAHSPANLGREANVFNLEEVSYAEITRIIREKDVDKFLYTIEFFPEEGKYHFDGHRSCQVRFSPTETKKQFGTCPQCKKKLTIGVMHRVDNLADRPEDFFDKNSKKFIPFKNLVPLTEIIAEVLNVGKNSKSVQTEYKNLIAQGKNEFNILLNLDIEALKKMTLPKIAEGVDKVRQGKITVKPGYDGVYGTVRVFNKNEQISSQTTLF